MTVNETLQALESTSEYKKSFSNNSTVVYSNGVEEAQKGYNEMPLPGSKHAQMLNVSSANMSVQNAGFER